MEEMNMTLVVLREWCCRSTSEKTVISSLPSFPFVTFLKRVEKLAGEYSHYTISLTKISPHLALREHTLGQSNYSGRHTWTSEGGQDTQLVPPRTGILGTAF